MTAFNLKGVMILLGFMGVSIDNSNLDTLLLYGTCKGLFAIC